MTRKLGLDLGEITLGVSVSDRLNLTAQVVTTIKFARNHYTDAIDQLEPIIKQYDIDTIVLGYPKNMDGTISARAKVSESFRKKLYKRFGINVVLQDERLTTKVATSVLQQSNEKNIKRYVDGLASQLILQSYLDKNGEKNV